MAEAKIVKGPRGRGPMGPRPKIKNPGKLFARIMKYVMRHYAVHCIIVLCCIFATVLCSIQGTMFTKSLIDDYIKPMLESGSRDFGPLLQAIGRVAIFYGIGILAAYLNSRLMVNVTQGTMKQVRDDLFNHMEGLPISYFDTHAHGDIMSVYTNDTDTLRQMISQSIPQFINSAVTVVSVTVSMLILSWIMTIVAFVMVAIMILCSKKCVGASSKQFVAQQKNLGAVNGFIEEMLDGQKVVKVFCHEKAAQQSFNALNDELLDSAYKANVYASLMGPINGQLGNLSYVVCAIVGGALALGHVGGFTPGALVSFLTLDRSFNMPISQISQQFNAVFMAMAGAERVFGLIDETPELDEGYVSLVRAREENGQLVECAERTGTWAWKHTHQATGEVEYKKLCGEVVFDDVDFGYVPEKIVLHHVDMYATPGQKIAFVGSTGAGKTTITNLINRFYSIQDGKIRYDGINVNKIQLKDLRKSLGMVLQDTHLFSMSVMENIRYGKLDATDEEVYAAAKLANADGFIRRLPDGYNTMLIGDGENLSQGQRQLLAIARAAIADPPVLILDEATSSIDTRTERLVQDGMDKLMNGRTTFVIAHRLSTIRNADCIMVLEKGCVIERGNHEQLIEKKGRYYQLYTGNRPEE